MSGFLHHLAARSFRASSTLRPKLPSLFEGNQKRPVAGAEEGQMEAAADAAGAANAAARETLDSDGRRFGIAMQRAPATPWAFPLSAPANPGSEPTAGRSDQPSAEQGQRARASESETPRDARPHSEGHAAETTPPSPDRAMIVSHERIVEIVRERDARAPEQKPSLTVAEVTHTVAALARPLPAPQLVPATGRDLLEERRLPPTPAESMQGSLLPKQHASAAPRNAEAAGFAVKVERKGRERQEEAHTASTAERAVHINIGRIEIVAETASTPSRRPSQHKPSGGITLEDYLRRKPARGSV